MLTYAIPDIHGMSRMLEIMLKAIADDAGGEVYRLVFLGDYGDRGPNSRQVIDRIRRGSDDEACVDVVLLQGNHDRMMIDYVLGDRGMGYGQYFRMNGGTTFLLNYAMGMNDPAMIADATFLKDRTRLFFRDEIGRIYVHAGLRPFVALEHQEQDDLQWIREGFLDNEVDHGHLVVHGHTICRRGQPDVFRNRVGLDTGAFTQSGALTVGRFDDADVWPRYFLSLPHTLDHGIVSKISFVAPSGKPHAWASDVVAPSA